MKKKSIRNIILLLIIPVIIIMIFAFSSEKSVEYKTVVNMNNTELVQKSGVTPTYEKDFNFFLNINRTNIMIYGALFLVALSIIYSLLLYLKNKDKRMERKERKKEKEKEEKKKKDTE